MEQKQGLETQILEQVIELTRDHQLALGEFVSRVEPSAQELVGAWARAYTQAVSGVALNAQSIAPQQFDATVRAWFSALRHGDVAQFYSEVMAWARPLVLSGLSYTQLYKLIREFQKATIPVLMRVCEPGPELELILAALDDLFNGNVLLVGASYIDLLQESKLADARMHVLGRATGGVTHKLSDTLVAVLGQLQLLIEQAKDAETRRELRQVQETAASGVQMLRYLRDFARDDANEEMATTDVNQILRNAAQVTRFIWRDQAEASGIFIDVVQDLGEVPSVLACPHQLERAFVSLLITAVEELPAGGRIILRSERQGDAVLASVIDSGTGTSEPKQARVYDPFFTTQGLPHADTSLSAVAQIVTEHRGTLTVNSQPGQGTTYAIALPIAPKAEAKSASSDSVSKNASVLVIDNEPLVRTSFARLLGIRGYRVTPAESGPAGIAAFKQEKFDVVFTDLGMPEMSGWDVAKEIKKISPNTSVVLVTAWPIDQLGDELSLRGVDRVLTKPFEVNDLFKMIDDVLAARR